MTIKIERTILDTKLNGLEVIKCVEVTQLLGDKKEYCISVCVTKEIISESRFVDATNYSTVRFFGMDYAATNEQYLEWLDTIVTDNDATHNTARGVKCLLAELRNF